MKDMKKTILFLGIFLFNIACNGTTTKANTITAETKEITKGDYYDKTLACMLGHIGGFLSGFEFVSQNGVPYVGLPDEWFSMCYGPYGGGPKHGSAGANCVRAYGQILQDDDYHVDFFNQLIFDQSQYLPTSLDIQKAWKKHQVRDWGGGAKAMEIINKKDFVPPFTGQLEYGNIFSWCTEPYIENETVGCVTPGMAQTADMLTNRFALTTGEYESVLWARFWGVMYAVAYFETDAVEAMKKASDILPAWSYAQFMYEKACELHGQYPNDWRTAAKLLAQYGRHIHRLDNVQVAYDINGGFTVLSILYGNNDYYESIKIASLMGYDGDCTAATVGGLLGIIKGMDGTHEKVKEVIYAGGEGVLINDDTYVPWIRKDYPDTQKFTELASLYQKNAEKVIVLLGGKVEADRYVIPVEPVKPGCDVVIDNRDFEDDDIEVKKELLGGMQGGVDKSQTYSPHSGKRTIRLLGTKAGASGKVYVQTQNLQPGKTYKVNAYVVAKGGNRASLFVQNGGQFRTASTFGNAEDWFCRSIVFKAESNTADIGLYVPTTRFDGLFNAYLDDITIDECRYDLLADYGTDALYAQSVSCELVEDNQTNASEGDYLLTAKGAKTGAIAVNAKEAGEHLLRIHFANTSADVVTARIMKDGEAQTKFPFYRTDSTQVWFEDNVVEVPVCMDKGVQNLTIEQFSGSVALDRIEIVADSSSYAGESLWGPSHLPGVPAAGNTPHITVGVSPDKVLNITQDNSLYSHGKIYSLQGTCLKAFRLLPGQTWVELSDYPNGCYILSCLVNVCQESVKFIL